MGSKLQKAGLALVLVALAGYLGWRAWQAGGLENLMDKLRETAPKPSAEVSPTPTPARATTSPTPKKTTPPPMPTTTATPTATPAATPASAAAPVIAEVNARRAETGATALTVNTVLAREAQEHADDMAHRGFFSHTDPDGITFQQRMNASGYASGTVAENLGLTSGGAASSVVQLWMGSEGHRVNMLNEAYRGIGVGVAAGTYQGQSAVYVVAIFGAVQ